MKFLINLVLLTYYKIIILKNILKNKINNILILKKTKNLKFRNNKYNLIIKWEINNLKIKIKDKIDKLILKCF